MIKPSILLSTLILVNSIQASANTTSKLESDQALMITDFESAAIPEFVVTTNANISVAKLNDSTALAIDFSNKHASSGVIFSKDKPWKNNNFQYYVLAFEAQNPTNKTINLIATVTGKSSKSLRRSVAIGSNAQGTYYFELAGIGLNEDTGLRDAPPSFKSDAHKMILRGGKTKVDFSEVSSIKFSVDSAIHENKILLDNIRIVESPKADPLSLTAIVDKFGQRADKNFAIKVSSSQELREIAKKELAQLSVSKPLPQRSLFGGWKDGPKLEATGYFRAEKVGNQWSLVDPEGYLFFSTGIANIRMSNTSTFTGVDFKDDSVRYVVPNDVTPEDSQGISGDYTQVRKTKFITNQQRHNMFAALPSYDDKFAKHYGYRRSAHMGPIEHGEVYSFYQANLERRYGETYRGSYLTQWRDTTVDRMVDWGFTSMGNWVDPAFYQNKRIPYFANGWIIGDFKTVSSGFDYWGAMPDPFDTEFVKRAKITAKVISEEVLNSPWCIGVFIDNEMSWGGKGAPIRQYGIVLDAFSRNAEESPTKLAFVNHLKQEYDSLAKLNDAWQKDINSWAEFSKGVNFKEDKVFSEKMLADMSALLTLYSDEYFRVVSHAIEEFMPNHMYMGARFTSWGTSPEAHYSAKKYADVISYNYYREGLDDSTWSFLADLDMPSLIGEFHMGTTISGAPHPGIVHAVDHENRGEMWQDYMNTVIDNPYMVGAHWFQYIDSPITGRAHDGENYNVGFVSTTDIPYAPLVKATKELHKTLYQRRFGQLKK
ncbi:agarase [Thalassotalea sp. PLHSN55]|uniref:agarase n=1 Tax=Thalassotalea sp. PLHSN55 TaxID=3435888 RepID=UPI003F836916